MKALKVLATVSLFVFIIPFSLRAQGKTDLLIELSRKWENSKSYALKIAALMPENEYGFKPAPEEMSFKQQLLHIADNINWLSSDYLNVSLAKRIKDTTGFNKEKVIKILSNAYDHGLIAHKLSDKQLEEQVKFFVGPMTRRQILTLMHDHQSHHLGQLIVYLRLKGIKPPPYVGW